jgi:hypothetical protein
MRMTGEKSSPVFDYRALRLLVGIIALTLPFVVSTVASVPLPSISASYYTEARDAFVGMLFVVGSFLWAYNGHSPTEARASKLASLAAVLVASFPTSCETCPIDSTGVIHYSAAAVLFGILAFFCFGPFRKNTRGAKGKKGRRSKIYFVCGWVIVGSMLSLCLMKLTVPGDTLRLLRATYWIEAISLTAFGIAWIVAGKYIRFLVDDEDALTLFRKKP